MVGLAHTACYNLSSAIWEAFMLFVVLNLLWIHNKWSGGALRIIWCNQDHRYLHHPNNCPKKLARMKCYPNSQLGQQPVPAQFFGTTAWDKALSQVPAGTLVGPNIDVGIMEAGTYLGLGHVPTLSHPNGNWDKLSQLRALSRPNQAKSFGHYCQIQD